MKRSVLSLLLCYIFCAVGCQEDSRLVLTRKKLLKDEVDTLAYYPVERMFLVNDVSNGFLGDFTNRFIFVRKGEDQGYLVEQGDHHLLHSKLSMGLVEDYDQGSGWFSISAHQVEADLPGITAMTDSLQRRYPKAFLREDRGVFSLYDKGEFFSTIHYGNLVIKELKMDFEALNDGVYRLDGDSMKRVSLHGVDLLQQTDGIYYVPIPGYKAIKVRAIAQILKRIKMATKDGATPGKIWVD